MKKFLSVLSTKAESLSFYYSYAREHGGCSSPEELLLRTTIAWADHLIATGREDMISDRGKVEEIKKLVEQRDASQERARKEARFGGAMEALDKMKK